MSESTWKGHPGRVPRKSVMKTILRSVHEKQAGFALDTYWEYFLPLVKKYLYSSIVVVYATNNCRLFQEYRERYLSGIMVIHNWKEFCDRCATSEPSSER